MIRQRKVDHSFYNHKVRYDKGDAISPWAWLTKTKWNIREEIVWNRGSGPEISGYRFIQTDERIFWLCKGSKHPRLPRKCAKWTSVWKFGPEMKNPHPAPYPIQLPARCIHAVMQNLVLSLILIVVLEPLDWLQHCLDMIILDLICLKSIMTWQEKELRIHQRMI